MTLDLSKPVRTRDGHEARIYSADGRNQDFPLVGEYSDGDGDWFAESWSRSGRQNYDCECGEDLINVPEPLESRTMCVFDNRGKLDFGFLSHRDEEIPSSAVCTFALRYHPDRQGTDMIEVVSVEEV